MNICTVSKTLQGVAWEVHLDKSLATRFVPLIHFLAMNHPPPVGKEFISTAIYFTVGIIWQPTSVNTLSLSVFNLCFFFFTLNVVIYYSIVLGLLEVKRISKLVWNYHLVWQKAKVQSIGKHWHLVKINENKSKQNNKVYAVEERLVLGDKCLNWSNGIIARG